MFMSFSVTSTLTSWFDRAHSIKYGKSSNSDILTASDTRYKLL
jgi:hypothetical protein